MRRVLAVVAAVGMVVVAVMARNAMDDEDGGGDGDSNDATVVICATDLSRSCSELDRSVEVRVEDPAVTAASLVDGTASDDIDAWITSTAWLEVIESRAPDSVGDVRAIATSPTVVATAPGRFDAINELCTGDDIWQCLGGHAGTSWAELGDGSNAEWRELKVGLTDADLAVGLSVLASASAGFFGTTDFAINDPRYPEFEAWLANLAEPSVRSNGEGDANPAQTTATRPGTYSAAGSTAAIVEQLSGRGLESIAPEVAVSATAVAAELARGDGAPDVDPVRDYLEDLGWARADEDDLAPTLKPGVMAALHSLWRAVTS